MKQYAYKKVDAFTSEKSLGNPAAYIKLHKESLTPEQMLEVGKEHAGFVSEFVFCQDSDKADVKLTYYSSECEVEFCGHGTVATMYDVIKNDEKLYQKEEILFDTNKKGLLKVYNRIKEDDAVYITAPDPIQLEVPVTETEIAAALGIQENDLNTNYAIDFIDAGLRTLLVPVKEYQTEISIFPNEKELKVFCENHGIDIILAFSKEASSKDFIAHTRVFAPKFGYLEDPATGSGNSAFGNYLLKNHQWDGSPVAVEQGGENIAFNTVKLNTKDGQVLFGGKATVRIEGVYYL